MNRNNTYSVFKQMSYCSIPHKRSCFDSFQCILFTANLQPVVKMIKQFPYYSLLILFLLPLLRSYGKPPAFVVHHFTHGSFALFKDQKAARILVDANEFSGVKIAARNLRTDMGKVTGSAVLLDTTLQKSTYTIIAGTIGQSRLINQLIHEGKINVGDVAGQWESTLIEVVVQPMEGIDTALIIAGSDKRGTIYGLYELSCQIGVSPWYYWADVPAQQHSSLFVPAGRYVLPPPAIHYRGIFLNDEGPALMSWAREKFGELNHVFYEKVFELILRLKGNYLWPAMWDNAFNDDDPLNPVLAHDYGIVMGTSHHEPMLRSQQEWKRYGKGEWNYEKNQKVLQDFWRTGIKNRKDQESIVTIGMRGDGDMPMSEEANIAVLEKIVEDQRSIITEVTGKPPSQTPQLWALYKEVQQYYDEGMSVPEDVTLLLCDDNWGNIRKLPGLKDKDRKGGYGIYYHFDYVGGPRNYKWLNPNPVSKVWEQMQLAYEYGARKIWIVNVGDLKPMEFPTEFFLDYAWDPTSITAQELEEYTIEWCRKQFGENYAVEIATLLHKYTKYLGRRKPELIDSTTFSLVNYNEFEKVTSDFSELLKRAEVLNKNLRKDQKDAFYQLVYHPIQASSNYYALYFALAKNFLYAKQGRNSTNSLANEVKELFARDSIISDYFNHHLLAGKWNHMMDQTHIGYSSWQQPEQNILPSTLQISVPDRPQMGVAIEGSKNCWTGKEIVDESFPEFNFYTSGKHFFEVFNRGKKSFTYQVQVPSYMTISKISATVEHQEKIFLEVDWQKAPSGTSKTRLVIRASEGSRITIPLVINNTRYKEPVAGFAEDNGVISMEAPQYSRKKETTLLQWEVIPDYGKTLGGMHLQPNAAISDLRDSSKACLEYDFFINDTGTVKIITYHSPTIDFHYPSRHTYEISTDDQPGKIVLLNALHLERDWEKAVADNIKVSSSTHRI